MSRHVEIFSTKDELVRATAEMIVATITTAIRERGTCALALSGGSTPREVYELLAHEVYQTRIAWPQAHLFWGDERMVPPEHVDSNFRMTQEALLARVNAPSSNVHRIKGELPPQLAAQEYRAELEAYFNGREKVFDFILLGLGEDGHTASLFPETEVLHEREQAVAAVFVPKFDKWRVTLTFPIINEARAVAFLVAGKSKAEIVAGIFGLPQPEMKWPASLIQPERGELYWLLDAEAAALMNVAETSRESSV